MTMWTPRIERRDEPLYLAIANSLAADIGAGNLHAGDRLPTHRDLATSLGVTVGTVSRGYAEAERRGLISGEVGRGSFVAGPRAAMPAVFEPPPDDVIDLSLNFPVHEDPDLAGALRRLSRRHDLQELLRYQRPAGCLRHREAGAAWVARCGLSTSADRIVICAGAQHALNVTLMTLTRPGDTVLVEELTYPGLKALADSLGLRLAPLSMDDEGLLPEAFDDACRRTDPVLLYCTPNLHNPTTATLSIERRRQIASIAEKHGVPVLEDDVHGPLLPDAPPPIAQLAPEHCVYVASLSKVVAGGLRVAYLAAPAGMAERLSQAVGSTIWMTPPLAAEIAACWIEDGTAETVARRKRDESAKRQALARSVLTSLPLRSPKTGYHVWLELTPPWRCGDFAAALRERGVAVAAADPFVVGRGPVPHAVRVSLGAVPDRRTLEIGLTRVAELLRTPPAPCPVIV